RIRSDHVVTVDDFAEESDGGLVLVMEYLRGQPVDRAIANGRMRLDRALSLGIQMLDGLAAAHAARVIHRELKPGNLFLESAGARGERLNILDFGISTLVDAGPSELTKAHHTVGTIGYMAPEQIRGAPEAAADPRVDLYAAGVSLFMMLTGKRPFD